MGVSVRSTLTGLWRANLAPLRHRLAESISENPSLHQIIFIVSLHGTECLRLISRADLLYKIVAEGPSPPVPDSTIGVKEPCSISMHDSPLIMPSLVLLILSVG